MCLAMQNASVSRASSPRPTPKREKSNAGLNTYGFKPVSYQQYRKNQLSPLERFYKKALAEPPPKHPVPCVCGIYGSFRPFCGFSSKISPQYRIMLDFCGMFGIVKDAHGGAVKSFTT